MLCCSVRFLADFTSIAGIIRCSPLEENLEKYYIPLTETIVSLVVRRKWHVPTTAPNPNARDLVKRELEGALTFPYKPLSETNVSAFSNVTSAQLTVEVTEGVPQTEAIFHLQRKGFAPMPAVLDD